MSKAKFSLMGTSPFTLSWHNYSIYKNATLVKIRLFPACILTSNDI